MQFPSYELAIRMRKGMIWGAVSPGKFLRLCHLLLLRIYHLVNEACYELQGTLIACGSFYTTEFFEESISIRYHSILDFLAEERDPQN